MVPSDIIKKYYQDNSELYTILMEHSFAVADKALYIAQMHPGMNADQSFIYEASMLHDIGVFQTNAPDIHCFGEFPYICHGYLGGELLRAEGLPRHALVSERHTGTGLSLDEIREKKLPLPQRDMRPVSIEEQIICFADLFYSKTNPDKKKSIDKIRKGLSKYGDASVKKFEEWCLLFLG